MVTEYYALGAMTIFFLFAWAPVSFGKINTYGLKWLASNRDSNPRGEIPQWAQRCDRAYSNLKDYFPAFVVAILVLGLMNKFDQTTKWASIVYVVCRLGHYIVYGAGITRLRPLFFFAGLFSNLYLLIKIFI